ncbi:MAG TPA: hypothetical protein VGG48_01170 [Rhizomicrobium sp.]|jgi:hypothetical protein
MEKKLNLWKRVAAALCGTSCLLASHVVRADEALQRAISVYTDHPQFQTAMHPKSVRGAVLVYTDIHWQVLTATQSVPADGSVCEPVPPTAPSPGTLPPFSVVKVLDQRSYLYPGMAEAECIADLANYLPQPKTLYRVVALNEDGSMRRTTDGHIIEGWADARGFEASSDPFATARAARQREGERWCPAGMHKLTAYFGTIWDAKSGQKLPSLGAGKPIEILGPAWREGMNTNQLCLARVESSGDEVLIEAALTSVPRQ